MRQQVYTVYSGQPGVTALALYDRLTNAMHLVEQIGKTPNGKAFRNIGRQSIINMYEREKRSI